MPRTSDVAMIPRRARNRFVATTDLIAALKSTAIPVCWTIPMIVPTQALAATSGIPLRAALVKAPRMCGRQAW